MKARFKTWNCIAVGEYYADGDNKAIELVHEETGEPIAIATVNLPDHGQSENTVFVKNYSENEGMVLALTLAKIIEGIPLRTVTINHVKVSEYRLTKEAFETLWKTGK